MSVKRYIATGTGMVVMRDGNCITYADYLKLEAERDALKELNGELVEALEDLYGAYHDKSSTCGWHPVALGRCEKVLNKAREKMG